MKTILIIIVGIFAVSLGLLFLPLVVGGFFAWFFYSNGNIGGAVIAAVIGLLCQLVYFSTIYGGVGIPLIGGDEDDCSYCGGGDTDGNHCYTCDDDF